MRKLNQNILWVICICFLSSCANYTPDTHYSSQGSQKEQTNQNLVVPPGLSAPETNQDYKIATQNPEKPSYLLSDVKNMSVQQGGSERWLVVNNKKVNDVWPMMVDFLEQQGLTVKYQNQAVGVIQTDWATQNTNVPQTGIRSFFSWVGWGSMYSMPTQYMFRVTLWQNESNTQIFVTDMQMSEVYPGCNSPLNSSKAISENQRTSWMAMPPNPQLELEFLMQFMAFSGLSPDKIKQVRNTIITESQIALKKATIEQNKIIINDEFDRAWWRTGLALDRVGLGVTDKNRTAGQYYVYSLQSQVNIPEQGFFSKLFGSGAGTTLKMPEAEYLVTLTASGSTTTLTMKPIKVDNDKNAKKSAAMVSDYLNKLAQQLY